MLLFSVYIISLGISPLGSLDFVSTPVSDQGVEYFIETSV